MSSLYSHQIKDPSLKSFIFKSLGGHVAAFGLLFGFGLLLKLTGGPSALEEENLTLVEASVRVDVVAMPRMTVKELEALQRDSARPEQVAAPAPKTQAQEEQVAKVADDSKAPVLEKAAAKPRAVSDILKEAAQRRKQESAAPAKGGNSESGGLSAEAQKRLRALVAAGNKLSTGSALTGSGTAQGEITPFHLYISQLPDLVRVNWRLPSYLSDQDLRCRIRIYLSERGDLIKAEIHEASGNEEYDRRALEAVRQSAPFPPLDEQIAARAVRGEVLLGFPL